MKTELQKLNKFKKANLERDGFDGKSNQLDLMGKQCVKNQWKI